MQTKSKAGSLDLQTIVDAAYAIFEEDGFDAISMRRVAERCGVSSPMSLYRYVGTKEELLVMLANRALEDLELPEPGKLPWQEEIAEVFRSVQRLYREHPEFGPIAAAQWINATNAYRGMEMVLGSLRRAGLDKGEAVAAYDALASFSTGFSQQHARRRDRAIPPPERLSAIQNLSKDEFENVLELAGQLVMRGEDDFDESLGVVISGIEAQVAAKSNKK